MPRSWRAGPAATEYPSSRLLLDSRLPRFPAPGDEIDDGGDPGEEAESDIHRLGDGGDVQAPAYERAFVAGGLVRKEKRPGAVGVKPVEVTQGAARGVQGVG